MDSVRYLDLKVQYRGLRREVLTALEEVCESTGFAQGRATSEFEAKFAAYCGVDHCVSLNSGTSALHLALRSLDVGPGDEVVTVSMTFIATAWAISYVGAKPVFVDIDPVRRTLNPDNLEAAITPRTKAIMPVHLYGMPAEMDHHAIAERHGVRVIEDAAPAELDRIMAIAQRRGLPVIEDAARARLVYLCFGLKREEEPLLQSAFVGFGWRELLT
jgi:dTDP-4-amino-4,6-dideoxygalactose transaminase